MAWAMWLAGPVLVTVLAAVWTWLRARPEPTPDTDEAVRRHADYLDALVQTARSKDRGVDGPTG